MLDVTLLSWTNNPVKTLYQIWECSRNNKPLSVIEAEYSYVEGAKLAKKLMQAKVPVVENIQFVFALENVPVSFREQMVRHRIGVHVGDNMGVDIVPDLADSTWWSQSMRILDMSKYGHAGKYYTPEWFKKNPEELEKFESLHKLISSAYAEWVEKGCPMEEAREVIPLGATHRITWSLNLASLLHIVGKRACWILQAGYWHPIIVGMIKELREKVDPIFADLADPPCIKDDQYSECCFKLDNERRVSGDDKLPPCPLYYYHEQPAGKSVNAKESFRDHIDTVIHFGEFWGRDPWVGNRIC